MRAEYSTLSYIDPSRLTFTRPVSLVLNSHGREIVRAILLGGDHKLLKRAFDWENTPEGHAYWSRVYRSPVLSSEVARKLEDASRITLAVQREKFRDDQFVVA